MTPALRVRCLRLLVLAIAIAWLWKAPFWSEALRQAAAWPLHDFFFPSFLRRVEVVLVASLGSLALSAWALVRGDLDLLGTSLAALAAASLLLLLHQLTFNDATFVTSLWTALFGVWLHRVSARPSASLSQRAACFAQLIVALLFLGGFVGKLTRGYWDGTVLYGMYFERGTHWTFAWARASLGPDGVRDAARWYARGTMAAELALASLPLWPVRASMRFALVALLMLVALNNYKLLSVTAPLMGMCLAVLVLKREAARVAAPELEPPPAGSPWVDIS